MRLKVLAISDTHLGEPTSLLSFPHGRQELWRALGQCFLGDPKAPREDFHVEQLILIGDIPDRTLSSTSQIITHTNALMGTLGSAAKIQKGVYLPGNHDHTVWTEYRTGLDLDEYGASDEPSGDLLVEAGQPCNSETATLELLSLFFGYPYGSSWRRIADEKQFSFAIANPIYATQVNGRTYVFAHGTHFRKHDVARPEPIRKLADYAQLDWAIARLDLKTGGDIRDAKSLDDLERIVAPFVDSLWPSSDNNPVSRSDQAWYLYTMLSGKLEGVRKAPQASKLYSRQQLPKAPKSRIKHLAGDGTIHDESVGLWQKHFLPHMLTYLEGHNVPSDSLTFVYGDTHRGGWGEVTRGAAAPIRIYNTGGWPVDNKKDHPPCHLFAVDDQGEEYLMDVSFGKVRVGGDRLVDLAAEDAENRQSSAGRTFRFILDLILPG